MMTTGTVDFTGVKWTMLMTLYLRALDSREKNPILGDRAAADAVDRIDYDFRWPMRLAGGMRFLAALRERQLDQWAADLLREHSDATVLHLGCGLDSRAFRLDLPSGAHWFDVDYPDVIELRRQLYAETDHYRMIASSVTDPGWLDDIPTGRPVLVIAEGLLMYLQADDVRALLRRLTDRFASGAVLFDGLLPWAIRLSNLLPGPLGAYGMGWAVRDEHQLEGWNLGLRYHETASIVGQYPKIPVPAYRALYARLSQIPPLRDTLRLFRFEF